MRVKTLLFIWFLLPLISSGWADDFSLPPLLRVSLVDGDVTYQRTDLDRWVELSVNTPILEGDKIWVGREGKVEIEFENGNFVRMSTETIVEFSRIGPLGSEGIELRMSQGLATFEVRSVPGSFTVHAPLFSAKVTDPALFRFDVEPNGSGRLVMFNGRAEVNGQNSRLFLRNGEVVRFDRADADRYYLATDYVRDDWDRWAEERIDHIAKVARDQFHNGDQGWVTADLNSYGTWYDVPAYGRVWRPTVGLDWAPFRTGRWVWYSSFGWTWISYEPWGWLPYHYGRWALLPTYGWSWVPGPRYASWCPGAVNWIQGPHWVGWVPLAPHEPWYGYGHNSVNVFISRNFGHRRSITYVPIDSFLNGTPARDFRYPHDPYADGRIIAGQPRFSPTSASRMPVASNSSTVRTYRNEDLQARRNLRDQLLSSATTSSSQGYNGGSDRWSAQSGAIRSREATARSLQPSSSSAGRVVTIPGNGGNNQEWTNTGSRSYSNWSSSARSTVRGEQRDRLLESDSSVADTGFSARSRSASTWVRPNTPAQSPTVTQPTSVSPMRPANDSLGARQRLSDYYRSRSDSGGDRYYQSPTLSQQAPRFNPYTPPSSPSAMRSPVGPSPSAVGPAVQTGGRGGPQPSQDFGNRSSDSRSAVRGRMQR